MESYLFYIFHCVCILISFFFFSLSLLLSLLFIRDRVILQFIYLSILSQIWNLIFYIFFTVHIF